ncbi:hypothetical protein [Ruegeria atlantica]|uniref:hypothetical protein n=1 Tax=Ruegeria atlantica TaxID=81569 RepID=UPI00147BCDD8|nr:hypothetical protein [Ruegeria atlantica]
MKLRGVKACLIIPFFVAACADKHVDDGERLARQKFNQPLTPELTLKSQSNYSALLSEEYVEAARRSQQGQDVAAVITFLAAGAFVSGAVGSASDRALANIAIAGAGSTAVATRTLSKTVIQGIYLSARRMNCVATVANSGRYILSDTSPNTKAYARAATYGAIKDIQIQVRSALARDVADFNALKTSLTDAIDPSKLRDDAENLAGRTLQGKALDFALLNKYLKLLDGCLADANKPDVVAPIDTGS